MPKNAKSHTAAEEVAELERRRRELLQERERRIADGERAEQLAGERLAGNGSLAKLDEIAAGLETSGRQVRIVDAALVALDRRLEDARSRAATQRYEACKAQLEVLDGELDGLAPALLKSIEEALGIIKAIKERREAADAVVTAWTTASPGDRRTLYLRHGNTAYYPGRLEHWPAQVRKDLELAGLPVPPEPTPGENWEQKRAAEIASASRPSLLTLVKGAVGLDDGAGEGDDRDDAWTAPAETA